jgi:hypothetical protein
MRSGLALVMTAVVLGWTGPLNGAELPGQALEASLTGSVGFTTGTRDVAPTKTTNVGPGVGATVLLRLSDFLNPYFSVGFLWLRSSSQPVDLGAQGTATLQSSLSTWTFIIGPAYDVWRLRIAAGVGIYYVTARSSGIGAPIAPSESDLGYTFSVTGYVYQGDWYKIGIQSQVHLIAEGQLAHFTLGLVAQADVLGW